MDIIVVEAYQVVAIVSGLFTVIFVYIFLFAILKPKTINDFFYLTAT